MFGHSRVECPVDGASRLVLNLALMVAALQVIYGLDRKTGRVCLAPGLCGDVMRALWELMQLAKHVHWYMTLEETRLLPSVRTHVLDGPADFLRLADCLAGAGFGEGVSKAGGLNGLSAEVTAIGGCGGALRGGPEGPAAGPVAVEAGCGARGNASGGGVGARGVGVPVVGVAAEGCMSAWSGTAHGQHLVLRVLLQLEALRVLDTSMVAIFDYERMHLG